MAVGCKTKVRVSRKRPSFARREYHPKGMLCGHHNMRDFKQAPELHARGSDCRHLCLDKRWFPSLCTGSSSSPSSTLFQRISAISCFSNTPWSGKGNQPSHWLALQPSTGKGKERNHLHITAIWHLHQHCISSLLNVYESLGKKVKSTFRAFQVRCL